MQVISSKDNELIKHIKKLKDKKYRDENNEYIVEGVKLIEEAVKEKYRFFSFGDAMFIADGIGEK